MKLTTFIVCYQKLNKLFLCLILLSIGFSTNLFSQNVAITDDDGYTAASTAMLDVYSLNKGMLVPRLDSTQRVGIVSPAVGLLVFDTTKNSFMYFNGLLWITIPSMNTTALEGKALFAVKNAAGDTVFAVYNDGVKVTVDEGSKGKVGGFAVSGRTPTKTGAEVQYFRVTPDSTRVYINDTAAVKGTVGGFAISGRTPTKSGERNYFLSTPDSTRIYINDTASTKGTVGGFAISGRTPTKVGEFDYLRVTPDSTRVYVNEGFTKGKVGGFAISGRTPTKTSLHSYFLATTDSTRVYINDTTTSKGTVGGFAISGRTPTKAVAIILMFREIQYP
jgi:trimeric autotransporter adhesin